MTELRLPEKSRAAYLLARLDTAHSRFVDGLPGRLRAVALKKGTYVGTSADARFEGVSTMNPGVTCTPWLFWELVETLDDERFLEVAGAGTLVVLASVLLDHIVDGQADYAGEISLLQQTLFQAGVARLRRQVPFDSEFWAHFERLEAEHVAGLAAELEVQVHPDRFSLSNFLTMVPGKFSPIVITMAAFAEVLGRRDLLAPIEASIKHLAIASQLLDDMGDWREDLEMGHLTFYMTRLAPPERWQASNWPSAEELQQHIDADWLDLEYMGIVQEWLDKSMEATQGLGCSRWDEYLDGYRNLADQHLRRYKARHMMHILGPLVGAPGAQL
jgi:hypothetical protein